MSLTSVDLPGTRHAGHRREHAQRERHVDLAQVVFARTDNGELALAVGRPPDGRDLDLLLARKIRAGKGIRVRQQLVVRCRCARCGRRARRPPGRCRPPSRRGRWCRGRARRRSACCPDPSAGSGFRSVGGCRADAGRSTARRARRAHRRARSRSASPAGCVAPHRRTAWPPPATATGTPARRRAGSRAATGSP